MKDLFFQLKSIISKNIQNLMKKPLFLEIIMGSFFSLIIIVISVSGFEKSVYKETFEGRNVLENTDDLEIDSEDTGIDFSDIEMGDALSVLGPNTTDAPTQNRNQTAATPSPTYVILETPSSTFLPTEEPVDGEIEELPEVTFLPEVTNTPEPEVILDPNGPVIVSDMKETYVTTSQRESITITAYNPVGNKLSHEYMQVTLNDTVIYPELKYNDSYTYILDYTDSTNKIIVNVQDENNNSKTYEYTVYYDIQYQLPAIISVDAASIGLGYMIKPTDVDIIEGKTVAAYVKELLSKKGYSTFSKGSVNSNYEFRGLYRADLYSECEPVLTEEIISVIKDNYGDNIPLSDHYNNFIKNGYFLNTSKWIFEINGVKYFDSMSNYTLQPGDILEVRFTLYNGVEFDYLDNLYITESYTPLPTIQP